MKNQEQHKALEVVRAGYNQLGNLYTSEREKADNWKEINAFTSALPDNGKVLDAGSGTGIPIARHLVRSGFEVTGIDFSETMIKVAKDNVPGAAFLQMDMTALDFPPESFDGVISTYAIIHIPRELHTGIFQSFHALLKTGGVLLVSIASSVEYRIASSTDRSEPCTALRT